MSAPPTSNDSPSVAPLAALGVVLDGLHVAFLGSGGDGRVVFANRTAERLLGTSLEKLRDAAVGDALRRLAPEVTLPLPLTEPREVTMTLEGPPRATLRGAAVPWSRGAGEEPGMVLALTTRDDAERERDELLGYYRFVVEALPQMVWTAGPDGAVDYMNVRWREYTGLGDDDLLGWAWASALHPEDRARCAELWRTSVESGRAYDIEYRWRRADGAYRWMLGRAVPLRDREGRVTRWFGTCTDIDDQKTLLEERQRLLADLGAKRALLDTIIQQMPAGIVARDAKTRELLFSNTQFQSMVGATGPVGLQHFVGEDPVMHADGRPYTMEELPIVRAMTSGEVVVDEELTMRRHDGSEGSFRCSATPIWGPGGEILAGALCLVDVTDVKKRERERLGLLAAEKAARAEAEAANRAKDEFLAMASHELRTPLNAILGWAQLLRSGKLDASAHLRAVETIERNGRAQVQLIEDILDGSRIITGKLHLEVRPFDMGDLVRAALDAVRPAAEAKHIRLESVAHPEPLRMSGDPERLQQVVWNLLSNALKFTPKGGVVSIAWSRVGDDVEIVVRDDGQGIAPDFLPHVFERFRQAEGSTTRRHGGLGLGLALVRHLAEAHGGTVRAESKGLGKGAAFYVHLPMSAAASEPSARPKTSDTDRVTPTTLAAPQLQGVTALVVDDEPDARDLVATVLRSKGAIVTTAAGAEEGVRCILRNPPMVLLSDIAMPGMDGYAFLAQVRTATGAVGAALPAIAITAYAREEDRRRAASAGFQAHVAKPVDPDHLVTAVANLVPTHREAASPRSPRAARPEVMAKVLRSLERGGLVAALRTLNARSAHRFTAVYRVDGATLRNVALVDAEDDQVQIGEDVPLAASYCSLVTAGDRTFTTEDAREDDRLRQHPARAAVRSYCGVVLRDAEGRPVGTLCHFDLSPCDIPVSEIPLLEAMAPHVAARLPSTAPR